MKFISLPINLDEKRYIFNPIFGMLLEFEKNNTDKTTAMPKKIIEALGYCNNPYTLTKIESVSIKKLTFIKKYKLNAYANLLISINKLNFYLVRLCSNIELPVFDNATNSILFFRNNKPSAIQNDLCLPRSLFAASTSKLFMEKGVIFIGVSLPSSIMHAWIIEDGKQPDPFDEKWIGFRPVAAFY
ncbi:MAG: hypothetical protein JWQ09_3154 [Segetibacter sp.]|nr:hypothetical protein [Segetibacter sp.]